MKKHSLQAHFLPLVGLSIATLLAGCGGVSELTKERVERSQVAVNQAAQTVGNSEAGALDLQRAKDNLRQAQSAIKQQEAKRAERLAHKAQLDADLAVAKTQSAAARTAADEVMASIETLRREASRSSDTP